MPNLLDVIELAPAKRTTKYETAFKDLLSGANDAKKFLDSLGAGTASREMRTKLEERLANIRHDAFLETLSLSTGLSAKVVLQDKNGELVAHDSRYGQSEDALSRLSQRSQAKLSSLRNTADMLNMVIMPFDVLDSRSLEKERSWELRRSVERFVHDADAAELDVYVIAPLSLYDIDAHVKLQEGVPDELYSKVHDTTLTTIMLQLPLFRTMFQSLAGLETRVASLEAVQTQMRTQISQLTQRLTQLEQKVEKQLQAAYEAKLQAEAAAAAAAAELRARSFLAVDPLAFAVKRGTSLTDEATAIVGPNWGPDFSDVMLEVCGLSVKKGQRKKLEATLLNNR